MIKIKKLISILIIILFLYQSLAFCIPERNSTLRPPSQFSLAEEAIEFIDKQDKSETVGGGAQTISVFGKEIQKTRVFGEVPYKAIFAIKDLEGNIFIFRHTAKHEEDSYSKRADNICVFSIDAKGIEAEKSPTHILWDYSREDGHAIMHPTGGEIEPLFQVGRGYERKGLGTILMGIAVRLMLEEGTEYYHYMEPLGYSERILNLFVNSNGKIKDVGSIEETILKTLKKHNYEFVDIDSLLPGEQKAFFKISNCEIVKKSL